MLDEEPFRDYKSPSNREILSLIKKGRVPPHLRDKYPHDDIMIDFKDKNHYLTSKCCTVTNLSFSRLFPTIDVPKIVGASSLSIREGNEKRRLFDRLLVV